MAHEEIDAIRAMLAAKPRPVGWAERRARLDEVGSVFGPPPATSVASRSIAAACPANGRSRQAPTRRAC